MVMRMNYLDHHSIGSPAGTPQAVERPLSHPEGHVKTSQWLVVYLQLLPSLCGAGAWDPSITSP
ncbi:hypothetical protein AB205_0123980 [Aquarana catesbeiana]|uniref:Uncharacterized protein n=1 Tax=Aquarana catesbeiana TaxID=8400 RepID=A0A2G9RX61_AQUCT|nr:hypothetical protein AB205_0123980 [Aquarana catesbeiana]